MIINYYRARRLANYFKQEQNTLATVESITAGHLAAWFTKFPNASMFFAGSIIPYQTKMKEVFLNKKIDTPVVSEAFAKELINLGKKYFDTDYLLAITGNAGPNPIDNEPIGISYLVIYSNKNNQFFEKKIHCYSFNRRYVTWRTTSLVLKMFYNYIFSNIN